MKAIYFLFLIAICFVMPSCVFPYHYTIRPGLKGTVVDARTSKPIALADVTFGKLPNEGVTRTDSNGSFLIPPQKPWGVYIVPMEYFPKPTLLTVQHTGYIPYTDDIAPNSDAAARGAEGIENIGVVTIKSTLR